MSGPRSKAEEEVDDFASSGLFSLLQRVSRKSKQTLADVNNIIYTVIYSKI